MFNNRNKVSRWSTFLLLCVFFVFVRKFTNMPWLLLEYYEILKKAQNDVCMIPQVDPFDPSIKSYISIPERLQCKQIQPEFFYLNDDGVLNLNRTVVKMSGYDNLECSYRCFSHNDGVDDDTLKFGEWLIIKEFVMIECEFIEVVCKRSFLQVYNYVFAHVKRGRHLSSDRENQDKIDDRLSVVIVGIDSMSRLNMVRQMPKSLKFLEDKLNGITFQGFTKVGDNTWVNLLAMLTGLRSFPTKEFPAELPQTEDIFFDDYAQYIWKNFSRSGYSTFFAEDRPDIQDFNYGIRKGFKFSPTDHYDRPLWLSMWWSFVHRRSSAFCYNAIPEHTFIFQYLRKFIKAYRNDKSFALLWWSNLSHDFLNKIGSADDDFVEFLQSVIPYLNNTILFVLSDHGHRYDAIRQTVIGRLETRMPFMNIVTPTWFSSRYPKAYQSLVKNSGKFLTTPFDIYATLSDVLHGNIEKITRQTINPLRSHALSLFKPILSKRNCKDAKIPEEYCPCYKETSLKPDSDQNVKEASSNLVSYVNYLLRNYQPPCAFLTIIAVKDAFLFLPHQSTLQDIQVGNKIPKSGFYVSYRIVVQTSPGGALLEGIVKYYLDDGSFHVEGDIDRNNAYGNSSSCITNNILRKYCYCLNV